MQLPKIVLQRHYQPKDADGSLAVTQLEFPGNYMDKYKELLGDANARVSVSADMALKDFGSGAGAMVTVTLSCNQDQTSIDKAIALAGEMAREYCSEQRSLAEQELQKAQQSLKAKNYGG